MTDAVAVSSPVRSSEPSRLALVVSPLHFSRQLTTTKAVKASSLTVESETILDKAYTLIEQANVVLDGGLHRCRDWEEAKEKYFHAGALLSQAGKTTEACTSFLHAANIAKALGQQHEEMTAVNFAGDNVDHQEPFKLDLLRLQHELFETQGLVLQSARTMKQAAEIFAAQQEHQQALGCYRQAVTLYKEGRDNTSPFVRQCEKRIRFHLASLGLYVEAAEMYEADAVAHRKGLSPTQDYMLAVLCYLAAASGEKFGPGVPLAKRKFSEYQDVDLALQRGRENSLLRGLIEGHDTPSLQKVDEVVVQFRNGDAAKEQETFDILIAQCRTNLEELLKSYDRMP